MQENKPLNITLTIIRVLVGALFIFSGLIKANDPSGLAYKMGEFYEVFVREGYFPSMMKWMNEYSLATSIAMITFEILAGVALIIGYRFKLFSYLIFLLTVFFTFLTGYALFSGNIKECGCFGDCIKLQANESFMKDLILLVLIAILLTFRKRVAQAFNNKMASAVMVISLVLCLWMQFYALKHLPFKDCLAYRIGNNLLKEMTPGKEYVPAAFKSVLIYEKDGVKKEFTTENFPWQDSTWKFVDNKTIEVSPAKNEPAIHDFAINSYDGADLTQTILGYKGNVFLLFVKDVNEANISNMAALQNLIAACKKANVPVVGLTASNDIESNQFKATHKLDMEFMTIDGTVCKTAMRTSPGLMLLKAGNVLGKWSYANYPSIENLKLDLKENVEGLSPSVPENVPVMESGNVQ